MYKIVKRYGFYLENELYDYLNIQQGMLVNIKGSSGRLYCIWDEVPAHDYRGCKLIFVYGDHLIEDVSNLDEHCIELLGIKPTDYTLE